MGKTRAGRRSAEGLRRALLALSGLWPRKEDRPRSGLFALADRVGPASLVATVLVGILAVATARTPTLLGGLLAVPLGGLLASGGGRGRPAALVAASALFSSIVAFPALFAWISPGQVLFPPSAMAEGAAPPWAVTGTGAYTAGRLVLRSTGSVAWIALLGHLLPFEGVLRGLAAWRVPSLLLSLLAMGHRYLEVLSRCAQEIHLARLSRTFSSGDLREEQAWVGAGMGSLFRRTRRLAEEVTLAMVSRGCTAEAPQLVGVAPLAPKALLLPAASAGLALFLLWLERQ
ncbi:MAG: CbiQ family ECF transporter T component [Acidobacteriota bacterium]